MEPTDHAESTLARRTLLMRAALFATGVAVVVTTACAFIVRDNEQAVVLRFGRPVRVISEAGFYGRLPWPIDQVRAVDVRLQYGEIRLSEALTQDKRNIIVPMYFAWRVEDPLRFLETVRDPRAGELKLDAIVTSARNSVLGQTPFGDLLATDPDSPAGLAGLERRVFAQAEREARELLGIGLTGVGILQVNLPEANTESVFRRMRAERKREASLYRAEGRSEAEQIRATADKEAALILAEARQYAQEQQGAAEAEAARIYAAAHEQDIDFYLFLRELQSLRSVVDKNTTLVLDTSHPPFDWIRNPRASLETLVRRDHPTAPDAQPALPVPPRTLTPAQSAVPAAAPTVGVIDRILSE